MDAAPARAIENRSAEYQSRHTKKLMHDHLIRTFAAMLDEANTLDSKSENDYLYDSKEIVQENKYLSKNQTTKIKKKRDERKTDQKRYSSNFKKKQCVTNIR